MSSVKSAVIVLCVCSVCYSVMLMLIDDGVYKRILKSIFGMAIIIIILSSFTKVKLDLDYSVDVTESQHEEYSQYADELTVKIAAQNLQVQAAEVLKGQAVVFERIEITMDIEEDNSIVIDRAEIYLKPENLMQGGQAIRILKDELGIDFTVKEV